MNIGEAATLTRLNAKTIRFYEQISLIVPGRAENGYRVYDNIDIHRLRFVQRSRSLGFTIEDCRLLLSLYEDKNRASADVKRIAADRIDQIKTKIKELRALESTLSDLVNHCDGDDRPDCPILDGLSGYAGKQERND